MAWSSGLSLRGAAGAQLRYGNGAPTASNPAVQADGDSYIDVQNGRLFAVRSGGTWPTTYASLIGPTGASVRIGIGAPTSSNPATQADGDVFIQTDALNGPALWGPRSGGTWPGTSTSLAGAAGASFLSGSGAPASSLGTSATPGYYDYSNFVIYGPKKSDGTWPAGNSLIGPRGSQFYTDTAAPGLQLGTVSDFFFRSDTYDFFIKVTNAAAATTAQYPNGWLVMANLRGAAGTAGTNGTNGSNGTNGVSPPGLYYGSGAPGTIAAAQVGSYYIRTDTTQLYGPLASNGTWGGPVSLIGALPANLVGQSIAITLPSSGAASFPYSLKNAGGTSLFNVDTTGNIAGGNIYGQGTLQMIGAATMAGVSATTLSASGAVTLSSSLAVTGATTLGSLAATSSTISGNETVGGTLAVTGATTLSSLSASSGSISGALAAQAINIALPSSGAAQYPITLKGSNGGSLYNVDSNGSIAGTNIYGQGTLTIVGAATLSSTLAVTGATTLSGALSVSGATNTAAITSTGTVTGKNITLTSGGGGALTFADGTTQSTAATSSGSSSTAGVTRQSVRGMVWLYSAPTANTAYSVNIAISSTSSSAQAYPVPLMEPMSVAGNLHSISAFAGGGPAATITLNILKNGSIVWTGSNFMTVANSSTAVSKALILPTNLTFVANDVITMTLSTSSSTGNQNYGVSLFYNQNS